MFGCLGKEHGLTTQHLIALSNLSGGLEFLIISPRALVTWTHFGLLEFSLSANCILSHHNSHMCLNVPFLFLFSNHHIKQIDIFEESSACSWFCAFEEASSR